MKKSNTTIYLSIALAFFFISTLVLIYTNYFIKKSEITIDNTRQVIPNISPTVELIPSEVVTKSDWRTYTDKVAGFQISYPSSWAIDHDPTTIQKDSNSNGNIYIGSLRLSENKESISLQFGTGFGGLSCQDMGGKKISVMIGGQKIQQCLTQEKMHYGGCGDCGGLTKDGTSFVLKYTITDQNNKSIVDQILSTFKFIDTPTSIPIKVTSPPNMKTYRSDQYGISFQYPQSARISGDLAGLSFTIISPKGEVVIFSATSNPEGYSVSDRYLRNISPSDPESIRNYISFSKVKKNNVDFVLAYGDPTYFSQSSVSTTSYLVARNNYVFDFNFNQDSGPVLNQILSTFKFIDTPTPTTQIVGNDKDKHGCIGSAGYSWCELKQKCLRPFEEKCSL